jgi:hypothetical protein
MIHYILGVHVTDRLKDAVRVQQLLTQHGGHIKTRLGLHELEPGSPSPRGLLLLELAGTREECDALAAKLADIDGIDVQHMVFTHP